MTEILCAHDMIIQRRREKLLLVEFSNFRFYSTQLLGLLAIDTSTKCMLKSSENNLLKPLNVIVWMILLLNNEKYFLDLYFLIFGRVCPFYDF